MMITFDVMKAYFIRLFNYDEFANRQIAELVLKTGNAGMPLKLMAHLVGAANRWLNRCMGLPPPVGGVWPEGDINTLNDTINNCHVNWINHLNGLNEKDFDKIINYKNSLGEEFNTRLDDILAHVINHGTHTRAQVGQYLKLNGEDKLPITDYVYYLRQLDNQKHIL